jgi:hypothetical protein
MGRAFPLGLDIGCAIGFYVRRLADLGWDAHGIDLSEYAVAEGRKRGIGNLDVAPAQALPFADESFDFVTAACSGSRASGRSGATSPGNCSAAASSTRRTCTRSQRAERRPEAGRAQFASAPTPSRRMASPFGGEGGRSRLVSGNYPPTLRRGCGPLRRPGKRIRKRPASTPSEWLVLRTRKQTLRHPRQSCRLPASLRAAASATRLTDLWKSHVGRAISPSFPRESRRISHKRSNANRRIWPFFHMSHTFGEWNPPESTFTRGLLSYRSKLSSH